ncbi:hypothetical protein WJ96_06895 [Burkholderia ubonensis]|uniref:Uncharacterized protein n=1 Tax=Burkholderia ubonensis TaxID=101571 RepID=A0AAW3MTM4_9BURK|nr:hypothetical protein [Burkholderia ubonensis]KVP75431.1 hypothetical protein WJ93_08690 [Burkholderia ubonensis]KVP98244.1 hypothetical protein WJ96_06895 [Burkholderia ubonensis]KVZ92941.1 hypothetical protein WL25_18555 [Burkholderia ubonensis]
MTNAIIIKKNVLPGFDLMQSQQDAHGWPKGAYGLVEINDPTVIFPGPLLKDPTAGMSDDELNALPELPAGSAEFDQAAEALGEKLILGCGHRPPPRASMHRARLQTHGRRLPALLAAAVPGNASRHPIRTQRKLKLKAPP